MKRLLTFITTKDSKMPPLKMCTMMTISISPSKPTLTFSRTTLIDIPSVKTQKKPEYHPYVKEAIKMLYATEPDWLTEEQWEHFRGYYEYKSKGEPIETDIVYKPRTS